jgi:ligand-binding SRPBCC domain-containing protein
MKKYRHHFQVPAPLKAVADFHARSDSMGAITPPPIIVRVHHAPPLLSEGAEMDFTLGFGPFSLRWVARIEDVVRPEGSSGKQEVVQAEGFTPARDSLQALNEAEEIVTASFADRQLRGPFDHWLHRHTFIALDETTTMVMDEIELKFRRHPLWGLVGLGMWLSLPLLFAYRAWKTRQLLDRARAG